MKLVNLIEEDFTNYQKPGMFLGFPLCSGKCNDEAGKIVCQNYTLNKAELIDISVDEIIRRYRNNPISKALICGGLEPFDTVHALYDICEAFRANFEDDIVIYTGYYPHEINKDVYAIAWALEKKAIRKISYTGARLIVKYGRFIPGHKPHFDETLGVFLASDNQYAKRIA